MIARQRKSIPPLAAVIGALLALAPLAGPTGFPLARQDAGAAEAGHEHQHGAATASSTGSDIPVVRSARSGPWSASATWDGGKVPSHGVKVQIRAGHAVTYDVEADDKTVIRSVFVAGELKFATDKNTRLNVGLLKIEASDSTVEEGFDCDEHVEPLASGKPRPALLVGTPEQPVAANARALIRL
ncbi:MAG TPA: G8 domain-containing protein, partial [Pirellulaceae bacterium]|nr:G8 domain-containing protein [Pirellulaceae bacterium]